MQCAAWLKDRREGPEGHEKRNGSREEMTQRTEEGTEVVERILEGEEGMNGSRKERTRRKGGEGTEGQERNGSN